MLFIWNLATAALFALSLCLGSAMAHQGPYLREGLVDDKPMPKNATFAEEKGVRCHGCFGTEAGGGCKSCQAGMRKNFTAVFDKPPQLESHVKQTMHSQMTDVLPDADIFWPSHDEDFLANLEQAMADDGADWAPGASKSFAFGGTAHMEFGCKVSFTMQQGGKVHKTVECGMKGHGMVSMKKEGQNDEEKFDFFMPAAGLA